MLRAAGQIVIHVQDVQDAGEGTAEEHCVAFTHNGAWERGHKAVILQNGVLSRKPSRVAALMEDRHAISYPVVEALTSAGPYHATSARTTSAPGCASASADSDVQPTIAGASWTSTSFMSASTMKRAKSIRRVLLLFSIGSPMLTARTSRASHPTTSYPPVERMPNHQSSEAHLLRVLW